MRNDQHYFAGQTSRQNLHQNNYFCKTNSLSLCKLIFVMMLHFHTTQIVHKNITKLLSQRLTVVVRLEAIYIHIVFDGSWLWTRWLLNFNLVCFCVLMVNNVNQYICNNPDGQNMTQISCGIFHFQMWKIAFLYYAQKIVYQKLSLIPL